MLIRTLFFALPALAIATSGYAQVPLLRSLRLLGKPDTDQIESEVGTSSKRRCGKNSGWNTERVTKPAGNGSATAAQRRSGRIACAGSRHSDSVADLLGSAFIWARKDRWTLGRVYRKGVVTFPSCSWPTTVRPDRFGFAAGIRKDFTGLHDLHVNRR